MIMSYAHKVRSSMVQLAFLYQFCLYFLLDCVGFHAGNMKCHLLTQVTSWYQVFVNLVGFLLVWTALLFIFCLNS